MTFEATLDRRLVRAGTRSVRHLLVRVTAPSAVAGQPRAPLRIAFVIDRSGSMAGSKLTLASRAVSHAIGLLGARDRFAIVVYDDRVDVLVAETAATVEAVAEARAALDRVRPGGTTNLSEGWLVGCDQVARESPESLSRALLLSDGLANVGLTDADELAHHAEQLRARGIVTTTFGLGADFDEALLQSVATSGGGNFYFIEAAPQIRDFFASELGEALEIVAPCTRLELDVAPEVEVLALSAFSLARDGARVRVDLGDLVSDQQVEVVLQVRVPEADEGTAWPLSVRLAGEGGALADDRELALTSGSDAEVDAQPRRRTGDRAGARQVAARARQRAVAANRKGDLARAAEVVRGVAEHIARYAGDDEPLQELVRALRQDAEVFGRRMDEMERKSHHWTSSSQLRSRMADGTSMRMRPVTPVTPES